MFFFRLQTQFYRKEINFKTMIYDKHKLIHIAIPKTATVSIFCKIYNVNSLLEHKQKYSKSKAVLREHPLHEYYKHGHLKFLDYEKFVLENGEYNDYIKFSFVRNPYDLVVSQFYYAARKDGNVDNRISTFKKFCHKQIRKKEIYQSEFLKTQTEYLRDSNGNINLDFIGKIENFLNDWEFLRKLCPTLPKYTVTEPKLNKSKKKPKFPTYHFYDKELQEFIYKTFEDDFNNFNYSKEII